MSIASKNKNRLRENKKNLEKSIEIERVIENTMYTGQIRRMIRTRKPENIRTGHVIPVFKATILYTSIIYYLYTSNDA